MQNVPFERARQVGVSVQQHVHVGEHPYRPRPYEEHVERRTHGRVMVARPRELLAAAALVALTDFAIWRHDGGGIALGGFGLAVFFVLGPLLLVAAARARRSVTSRLVAIGLMLAVVAARCAYSPTIGTALLGLLAVFALVIALRERNAFLTNIAASFASTLLSFPYRIAAAFQGARRVIRARRSHATASSLASSDSTRGGRRFTTSILIPAALVGVFITIFAFANPLVARWIGFVGHAIGSFGRAIVLPNPVRVGLWMALAFGAVLILRPAIRRASTGIEAADDTSEATDASLVLGRNALVALNVLFLLYNALDATYLWAGAPPPGVSEQAYAHQGAAWLTVGLLVLTAVVGVLFRGALAHDPHPRARLARILAYAWLAQGGVLALGTFRRLAIHVSTSGLSNIRILGMIGTTLVAFGLVLIGTKLRRHFTFTWLLRRQLDALVVALLTFAVLPTHLISARVNASRILMHRYQALVNVTEEAEEVESASALLPLVDHDDERVRRGVAALLLNELDVLRQREEKRGFRDMDFATHRTRADLESARSKLESVLGDVDRSDAIRQWEYIRNSAIEGAISQSEIDKVEKAPAGDQRVLRDWITAHRTRNVAALENAYADHVRFDSALLTRAEVLTKKRAASDYGLLPSVTDHVPSPIAIDTVSAQARIPTESGTITLILAQQSDGWKIIEERTY